MESRRFSRTTAASRKSLGSSGWRPESRTDRRHHWAGQHPPVLTRDGIRYRPMIEIDLQGKRGLVMGVANSRSLGWAIAERLHAAGAELAFSYQGERLKEDREAHPGLAGDAALP